MKDAMALPSENSLVDQILGLALFNPHSGADVELDDVLQYLEEAQALDVPTSADGFKMWLSAPNTTEGLLTYADMLSRT